MNRPTVRGRRPRGAGSRARARAASHRRGRGLEGRRRRDFRHLRRRPAGQQLGDLSSMLGDEREVVARDLVHSCVRHALKHNVGRAVLSYLLGVSKEHRSLELAQRPFANVGQLDEPHGCSGGILARILEEREQHPERAGALHH